MSPHRRLSDDALARIERLIAEVDASVAAAERVDPDHPDPDLGSWHLMDNLGMGEVESLVAEVRERRAAEQSALGQLPPWQQVALGAMTQAQRVGARVGGLSMPRRRARLDEGGYPQA